MAVLDDLDTTHPNGVVSAYFNHDYMHIIIMDNDVLNFSALNHRSYGPKETQKLMFDLARILDDLDTIMTPRVDYITKLPLAPVLRQSKP